MYIYLYVYTHIYMHMSIYTISTRYIYIFYLLSSSCVLDTRSMMSIVWRLTSTIRSSCVAVAFSVLSAIALHCCASEANL